jgi:heme oxygenase
MATTAGASDSSLARQPAGGAMSALRAASWPCHQRLEQRIDIAARCSTVTRYRAYLEKLWGYCAAFEEAFDPILLTASLHDYDARRKTPLLARDLEELGRSPAQIASLPRCGRLPGCADTAAVLGCVYVFEGATLGGRSLVPLVASNLGLDAAHGAAFLASYGVGPMWRCFGMAVELWCALPERRARAVGAAIETFDRLGDWLCDDAA